MDFSKAIDVLRGYDGDFPDSPSQKQIDSYRRKFAKKYHPDVTDDTETLKTINQALDALEIGWKPSSFRTSNYSHSYNYTRSSSSTYTRNASPAGSYPFDKAPDLEKWAWAGQKGDDIPDDSIEDEADINSARKKSWEAAGSPEPDRKFEYRFTNFDGKKMKGKFTSFARDKTDVLQYVCGLMVGWDRDTSSVAVIVQDSRNQIMIFPVHNGYVDFLPMYVTLQIGDIESDDFLARLKSWLKIQTPA